MNGEGQRHPPTQDAAAHDAPEPGNARFPQPGNGTSLNGAPQGQAGQEGQGGGGRRRVRRQRRGGRGRGKNKQGGQQQNQPGYQAPLDAQGRIVDVENDQEGGDDDGPEETAQADGNVAPAPGTQATLPGLEAAGNAAPAPAAAPAAETSGNVA